MRIDLACPHCQQLFKVRLRKLQFGADLVCRLSRHEFAATEISDRPEVQEALARMRKLVKQHVRQSTSRRGRAVPEQSDVALQDREQVFLNRSAADRPEEVVAESLTPANFD